jgi:phage/plasmid primase-like uncharacterized protein
MTSVNGNSRGFNTEVEAQFLAAMRLRNLALTPGKQLIADGQWHRCDATNKRDGRDDGSYVLHVDGPVPWGLYRNWTDGKDLDHWRGDVNRTMTDAERAELEQRMEEARKAAEIDAAAKAKEAAEEAKRLWERSQEASDHPYLRRKKIHSHGVRVVGRKLLVPMYTPECELVNVQFIDEDGSKFFLRGGRVKGCLWEIDGKDSVIEAEGFATAAKIHEATGYNVILAFSAGNLGAVAKWIRGKIHSSGKFLEKAHDDVHAELGLQAERPASFTQWTRFIVAADDDHKTNGNPGLMKGLAAARVGQALIAFPYFRKNRRADATDFNDLAALEGLDAVREDIDKAVEPQTLLEERLLAAPHTAHGDAMIEELAAWKQQDVPFYEKLLERLSKAGARKGELDRAVKTWIKQAAAKAAAAAAARARQPEVVDIEALAKSAASIIASDNVLELFAKAHAKVFVGEKKNAKLLYLICTSRLFNRKTTMHGAVKGPSGVGKSELMHSVAQFMPPEDVFPFTSLSEKALLYLPDGDDLKHKILLMAEAPEDEKQQLFQDMLLRELMSEGQLRYPVTQKIGGQLETVIIEVEGPVAFLVSTTKHALNPQNETRLLSLEMDDSAEQTKLAMEKVAKREGWNQGAGQIDFPLWHDYQRYVAAGERRVYVPFAVALVNLIPPKAVRLRRDVGQLIRAIKVNALLHRDHRKRNDRTGAIRATFGDYAAVRDLMVDPMSEGAEVKMRKATETTIAAVRELLQAEDPRERNVREHAGAGGVTVRQVAQFLKLDRSAAQRRLRKAADDGYLVNLEQRKGHAARYDLSGEVLEESVLLPTVEELELAYKARADTTYTRRAAK